MKTVLALFGAAVIARKVAQVVTETYRVGLVWQVAAKIASTYPTTARALRGEL